MAIKKTYWVPDTCMENLFIIQSDDGICIEVQGANATKDPAIAQSLFEAARRINHHKNYVVAPAILAALPESEKIRRLNDEGLEEVDFKNQPRFSIVDGKLKGDFSAFKDEKSKSDAAAILEAENAKVF